MSVELKPFQEQGHFTEIHDAVFDVVMPMCPPNAWKILCFVIRKTKGWRKDRDALSYSQIREGCGISSDATVRKALDWLTDKNNEGHKLLNAATSKDKAGRQRTTLYSLNRDYVMESPPTETEGPTTESKDGFATETVDGPTTETVETITTLQEPHYKNKKETVKEKSCSQEAVETYKRLSNLLDANESLLPYVQQLYVDYPNIDIHATAVDLALSIEGDNPYKYKSIKRALKKWVSGKYARERVTNLYKMPTPAERDEAAERQRLYEEEVIRKREARMREMGLG